MSPITSNPTVRLPDQFNTTTAFLDRHLAEGRGHKTAIYYEGEKYIYAQIAEVANRVGNGILDLGVEMEQRVALILLDSPQFAACLFGAIKIGAVPIPLNTMMHAADYVYLLNDSCAKALFIHASLWKSVQQVLPQLKYLRHVVVVGLEQGGESETTTLHDFERWASKSSSQLEAVETSKDDSLSSVRLCVSAGEALPADILRSRQEKFHVDILDGIGSTEILHIFISNRSGEIRPGSTGKLVPGYEARILDEHGLPVKKRAVRKQTLNRAKASCQVLVKQQVSLGSINLR